MKLKTTITEIKNSIDRVHGRLVIAEEIISKQKDRSEENLPNDIWRDIEDTVTMSKMFVFVVPEKRRELSRSNI